MLFSRIILFCIFIALEIKSGSLKSKNSELVRRKRYLVFPEGSTLSVALCMTAQTTLPAQFFTEAINWGIAYELPNDSSTVREFFHPKHIMKRRHRRDLYQKMEVIMDSMGFDGRSCILRSLCEASQRFLSTGSDLLQELVRIILDFPQQKIMAWEPEEHRLYHWAYRIGKENKNEDCSRMFPQCSFSLLDMALGEYSNYLRDYT